MNIGEVILHLLGGAGMEMTERSREKRKAQYEAEAQRRSFTHEEKIQKSEQEHTTKENAAQRKWESGENRLRDQLTRDMENIRSVVSMYATDMGYKSTKMQVESNEREGRLNREQQATAESRRVFVDTVLGSLQLKYNILGLDKVSPDARRAMIDQVNQAVGAVLKRDYGIEDDELNDAFARMEEFNNMSINISDPSRQLFEEYWNDVGTRQLGSAPTGSLGEATIDFLLQKYAAAVGAGYTDLAEATARQFSLVSNQSIEESLKKFRGEPAASGGAEAGAADREPYWARLGLPQIMAANINYPLQIPAMLGDLLAGNMGQLQPRLHYLSSPFTGSGGLMRPWREMVLENEASKKDKKE